MTCNFLMPTGLTLRNSLNDFTGSFGFIIDFFFNTAFYNSVQFICMIDYLFYQNFNKNLFRKSIKLKFHKNLNKNQLKSLS